MVTHSSGQSRDGAPVPTWRPTFRKAQPAPTRGPLGLNLGLLQLNPISARSCWPGPGAPRAVLGRRAGSGLLGLGRPRTGWLLAWHVHREQCSVERVEKMVCTLFMQAAGAGAFRRLGPHSFSPAASGVPQLVEPVLWDYGADLDVQGKGQYRVAGEGPVT